MEIVVVDVDVAAADAKTLAVTAAVIVAVAVVVAAAAVVVVGVQLGAAAVPAGITVASSVPLNSGAVDQTKPIAAVREPVAASVEYGVKLRQDQT